MRLFQPLVAAIVLAWGCVLLPAQAVANCVFRSPLPNSPDSLSRRDFLTVVTSLIEPPLQRGRHDIKIRGPYLFAHLEPAQQQWLRDFLGRNKPTGRCIELQSSITADEVATQRLGTTLVGCLRRLDGELSFAPARPRMSSQEDSIALPLANAVSLGPDGKLVVTPRATSSLVGARITTAVFHLQDDRVHVVWTLAMRLPEAVAPGRVRTGSSERRLATVTLRPEESKTLPLGGGLTLRLHRRASGS